MGSKSAVWGGGRGLSMRRAFEFLTWAVARRFPFTAAQVAHSFHVSRRTAYRTIAEAEAAGLLEVVHVGPRGGPSTWASRIRLVIG